MLYPENFERLPKVLRNKKILYQCPRCSSVSSELGIKFMTCRTVRCLHCKAEAVLTYDMKLELFREIAIRLNRERAGETSGAPVRSIDSGLALKISD